MYKQCEYIIRDQEHLDELLEYWMQKLNMNDWEIYAHLNPKHEMDQDLGRVSYLKSAKKAVVGILNFHEYKDKNYKWDQEKTLVHELMHVHLGILDTYDDNDENTISGTVFHQLVESTAKILVSLKRSN